MSQDIVNLIDQMKLIVELQGLDTQILKMRRELASMPEELQLLEDEFSQKTASLKKLDGELKALQIKRKEKELDLESKEGAIKKYQAQQYQVKTNKEYSALELEMSRVRADNSLIEEEIILILDQIDLQNQRIVKEKEALKSEEVKLSESKSRKNAESKVIESELGVLTAQRDGLSAKIDKAILAKYGQLLENRDGLAVVPILSNACQGCFQVLPPQVINEVNMKNRLVLCENCSRILYLEE